MTEHWCKLLVQFGKRHPKLRRPVAALLAALFGAAALWEGAKHSGGPFVMTKGRAAWNAARKWCVDGLRAAKTAAPACLARLRELGADLARRTVSGVGRMADSLRAEAPALRRHAPRRAMAMALTLCMVLSLLPAGALAAEGTTNVVTSACTHIHDENCGCVEAMRSVPCDKGCIDTDGDGVIDHAPDCAYTPAVEGQPCTHEHDADCGGLTDTGDETNVPPEAAECTCGALPDEAGVISHAEDCQLNSAPEPPDPDVEAVRALLSALPAPADVAALMAREDATDEDYALIDQWAERAQRAQDAYDALTEGQKALLPDARSTLAALTSAFRGEAATLDATVATLVPIATAEDLKALATAVNTDATTLTLSDGETYTIAVGGAGTTFALTADIDLSSVCGSSKTKGNWTPIGENTKSPFLGVLDGGNYTISKLYMDVVVDRDITDNEKYKGLVGYCQGTDGQVMIKDLTMKESYISGDITHAGGVVGKLTGGTVENCNLQSTTVAGESYIGGVVGWLQEGFVKNCHADANSVVRDWVTTGTGMTASDMGGIVGLFANRSTIENCTNQGSVSGRTYIGGIAGRGDEVETAFNSKGGRIYIKNCHNSGQVIQKGSLVFMIGGIVGSVHGHFGEATNGEISDCSNTADIVVQSEGNVGGIAGGSACAISRCYNTGDITMADGYYATSRTYMGGIVGYVKPPLKPNADEKVELTNMTDIVDCYNTGKLTNLNGYVGGIGGYISSTGKVERCYNTGEISCVTPFDGDGIVFAGGIVGQANYHDLSPRTVTIQNCVSLGRSVTALAKYDPSYSNTSGYHRLVGNMFQQDTAKNNYARRSMSLDGSTVGDGDYGYTERLEGLDVALGAEQDWTTWFGADASAWKLPDAGATLLDGQPLPTLRDETSTFHVESYTVTFYDGDTPYELYTPQAPQSVLENTTATKPSDPSKRGNTFEGWGKWVDETYFSAPFNFAARINKDTGVYAKWIAETYTVSYDRNDGSEIEPPASQEIRFGTAYTIPEDLTRTGYTFLGWFTRTEDGEKVVTGDLCDVAGDHTLYAQWKKDGYAVSFDGNGGYPSFSETVAYREKYTIPTGEPTRPGFVFGGWYTERRYGTGDYVSKNSVCYETEDHTFYAHWGVVAPEPKVAEGYSGVYDGKPHTITVQADVHPGLEYSYRWYPGTIDHISDDNLLGTDPTLQVTNVSDSGIYTCRIFAKATGENDKPTSGSNWSGGYAEVTVSITAKPQDPLTITGMPETVTYGDKFTLSATGGTGGGSISWSSSDTSAATVTSEGLVTTKSAAEAVTITATKYGPDASYEPATASVTFAVAPKQLTIAKADLFSHSKPYDGTLNFTVPYQSVGKLSGVVGSDDVKAAATGAFNDAAVGANKSITITYTLTGTAAGNYLPPAAETQGPDSSFEIRKKLLDLEEKTFTSRPYDGTNEVAFSTNGVLTGVVGDEDVYMVSAPAVATMESPDAYDKKSAEATGFVIDGADVGNYGLTYVYGKVDITPRPYGDGTDFTIEEVPPQLYTGKQITPRPQVKFGDTVLKSGNDFWYRYGENTDVGEGTVQINFDYGRDFSGSLTVTFTIENPTLPEEISKDDIFEISGEDLLKWHNEDITLAAKDGWTVGTAIDALGASVTLSAESTRDAEGKIVPSGATLYVKNSEGTVYQTSVDYKLDKTEPVITVTGETDGEVVGSWGPSRDITFTVTDNLSGIIYVSHCGNRVGNNDIIEPELNPDGSYTFTALVSDSYTIGATDGAKNYTSHGFFTQQLDGVKPTATFEDVTGTTGANGWFTGTVTVSVLVEDPESTPDDTQTPINESDKSGVANWEYSLDGGENWTEMAQDATSFTIDTNGDYTDKLRLRATDNAGNVSETAAASVKLDTATPAPPTVTATVESGQPYDGAFTAKPVTLTATAGNAVTSGATLQYKLGDGAWVNASTVTHSENTSDTGVTYTFRALSGAGTASTEVTQTVKYRALSDTVKDAPDNKYGDGNFSIGGEGVKDGWYTEDVTVTVTKKENITDGSNSYPADTYYKLDGGEKAKLDGSTISITTDGVHTLEIWTEDASGNETTHLELTVKIDKIAPAITYASGNPADWTKEDAAITFTADDETSKVDAVVVKRGETVIENTGGGFTADQNGDYVITVTDHAGNSATATVTVNKIDKAAPAAPTVTGYASDTWVRETITFTLSTTDTTATVPSGTKFQVKVGDAAWAVVNGNTYAVTENTDGVAYSFRTISGAGVSSEGEDFTVRLDKTAPVITLAATADGAAYDGSQFTAHDVFITPGNTASNLSGVTYFYQKTGDTDWTELTGEALTVDFNCNTTFTFKAVSGAGADSSNQPTAQVKRSAMSDEELAETEYGESDFSVAPDKSGEWYTETPTVTVTPKEAVGVGGLDATTYYELYKKPAESGDKTKLTGTTIKPDSDGVWTLNIWTEDAAGNQTEPYTIILKVDATAPTINDVSGNPKGWTKDDAVITFKAADATSGIKSVTVTCDDGQSVTYTNGGLTADRNGVYTITATDEAGHSTTKPITVAYIEKTAPVITDVTLNGTEGTDGWYTTDATVTVTATDAGGSELAADAYSFDGGATWQSGSSKTYSESAAHTVTVWVRDAAGNLTKRDAIEIKLDKEIPAAPTVTATAGGEAYISDTFTGKDVVFTLDGTATTSGHVKYQVSTDSGATWSDVTGSTLTHNTNTDDAGVIYRFRAVNGAGTAGAASADTTVKRRALNESVLTDPDNVYDPDELIPSTPNPAPDPGDTDFPYAPYWWTENPTITVPETPYIKDPAGPVIPGTDPEIHGYEATTYYKLWREGTDAEPGKAELTAPFDIKPNADGIWTLELWTEDSTGNETTHLIRKIQVDTTAPTVTEISGNATAWQNTDVKITVNGAADATSGLHDLAYSFDGGTTWQAANAKTFAANANVTVWVRDKAGNTYKHAPIAIDKIDKTAPVVTWEKAAAALDANKWYGKTALTATATDDSGETPAITLTASGTTYANGAIINLTGSYTFYANAADGAGNVGRSTALTVRIETLIDDFTEMVNKLDGNSTYQSILDAVNWYNGQNTTIKDRFSKSDEATTAYETLMGLLRDKAQEAADGVTDAIKNADTIDEIERAGKDYDSLPDEAKDQVPDDVKDLLEQKKKDADAAQKVIDQLENADRDKGANGSKDPGGSYDEKDAAQDAYEDLTDDQKALADQVPAAVEDKEHINNDLTAIDHVLDLLKDIQKPYTPATKDQIKAAGDAYDALTQKQKDAFPKSDKAKLDALEEMRQHAQGVEDAIKALGDSPAQGDLNSAKGAYDSLTADEKAMADGALKDKLDQKYQDMLDKLDADEKAAAEFAAKVEEVKNAPTVDKIKDLIKDHDALSDAAKDKLTDKTKEDYQKLADDLNKAQDVIDKLDDIDLGNLTPDDMDDVGNALDDYNDLDDDQKNLVDDATGGKADILDDAVKGVEDATDKIESIPGHGGDSTNPDGGPDLGDCDNPGNSNAGNTGDGGHDYNQHRTAIEEAKIAYERLTDAGRKLISDAAKDRLNREYAALMAYLEYINTAQTDTTTVEVAGLAEKVALPAESASAPKTVISVVMTDTRPTVMPTTPAGKTEALSVNIKLVAKIYDNPDATAADTPIAQEQVQPKNGEAVLVKLKVPTGYQNDTLELWHVKDNGGRSRIEDFWLVTEPGGIYAVFEVSSFSHFVFFAEKTPTGDDSSGWIPSTPKPDIPSTDNGSTSITPQRPKPGDTVTITPKPDDGYVVDEVTVTDPSGKDIPVKDNGDGTYSYTQPKGKVTISVTFKPEETRLPWNPFTDVTERDWFYGSVKYVYEKSLMNGTASNKFSPYPDTSRGMIATILWRLEGEPEAEVTSPFSDVTDDAYYTKAVAWGAEHGIVKGYGSGNFGPNDPITREQMAAILYRYTQFKGMDIPAPGDLSQFTDQPSAWAAEAMRWAVGSRIITGKGGGILDPLGKATRAETAAMLMRYLENTAK